MLTAAPIVLVFLGLALVSAVANAWAYVLPVDGRFLALVGALAAGAWYKHRLFWRDMVAGWSRAAGSAPWWIKGVFGLIAFIALLKSAAPSEMFDEGGYYMPYIRWIEQYPIVPGIANLEDRFGFNSSFHMASAVFGWAWLVPGGSYDLNGLLLLLFAALAVSGIRDLVGGRVTASAMARSFGLFYLMRNMLTAASADLPNILLGQTVVILALQRMEAGNDRRMDHGFRMIVLLCVFLATIKLSSLFLGLIPLVECARMLRSRVQLRLWPVMVGSLVVVLPWLGRFPVLSGYLLYPIYRVDLLDVDWKVPQEVARQQYYYVSEFAKTNARPGESEGLNRSRPMREWVPGWFRRENAINKGMILAVAACLAGLAVTALLRRGALREVGAGQWVLLGVLAVNILLWFARNPAMRFGWAWLVQFAALAMFLLVRSWRMERPAAISLAAVAALVAVSGSIASIREERERFPGNLLRAASPMAVGHRAEPLGSFTLNVAGGSQCWGVDPPCVKHDERWKVEARGARVEDGFRTRPLRGEKEVLHDPKGRDR